MLRRLAVFALAVAFVGSAAVVEAGCAGPYSGKAERLKRPKKKKRPEPTEQEQAAQDAALDDKCRTNFFGEPYRGRRRAREARQLAGKADGVLVAADGREGQERITAVVDALSTLRNALKNDPYGPEPTYKMAVAYAMVGKKGCAVQLLARLAELTKMPEVQGEAERTVKRALNDPAFDPFRKDADAALGQ